MEKPQDYIGKTFKNNAHGFQVKVESVVVGYNFGGRLGRKDAFRCINLQNRESRLAIYSVDTFDGEFTELKPQTKA